MNVYLGFGHPLPIWLAVIGVVVLIAEPFLIVAYVREALGPHEVEAPARDELPVGRDLVLAAIDAIGYADEPDVWPVAERLEDLMRMHDSIQTPVQTQQEGDAHDEHR